MIRRALPLIACLVLVPSAAPAEPPDPFARSNIVAWCVVPFDKKNRTPAERAEMLATLGFTRYAYDWRAQHLPTFDAEVGELKKRKTAKLDGKGPARSRPAGRGSEAENGHKEARKGTKRKDATG